MLRHWIQTRSRVKGLAPMPNAGHAGTTSWLCCNTASTASDCQIIFLGSGVTVPRIHRTWSPWPAGPPDLWTFHMRGPSCSPLTTTSCIGSSADVEAGAGECADATGEAADTGGAAIARIAL